MRMRTSQEGQYLTSVSAHTFPEGLGNDVTSRVGIWLLRSRPMTHRIQIKHCLTGKPRLIFVFCFLIGHWSLRSHMRF